MQTPTFRLVSDLEQPKSGLILARLATLFEQWPLPFGFTTSAMISVFLMIGLTSPAHTQGHGPVYGLSTPTLGRGAWSVDLSAMGRVTDDGSMAMIRPMVSYGITEDLQISGSFPIRLYRDDGLSPIRSLTRMPATDDLEITIGWRFHRTGTGVGSRVESTAYASLDYPASNERSGVTTMPRITAAAVTGYASRMVYVWVGGLYSRSLGAAEPSGDRIGDTIMYSVVLGYRPALFRHDYPAPDWRVFVEAVGEWSGRDRVQGTDTNTSGGHRIWVAPTVLGLYGTWGIAGGPAFPVHQRLNGIQRADRLRWVVNVIVWF